MSNLLRARIASCYRDAPDDAAFVSQIETITDEFGDLAYQQILSTLAGLHFDPPVSRQHFDAILAHQRMMSLRLDRPVRLLTAITDYFSNEMAIEHPRLIEVSEFERVLARAMRDTLTGVLNRQYFEGALQQQLALAERMGTSLALLFLDVDDFKAINDTYGHLVGDAVLKGVARLVQHSARDSDVVARYGGEEFVVLMPSTDALNATVLAERIRESIAQHESYTDDRTLRITISGGIAAYPDHARRADELIYHADSALYRAKGAGKNTICLFKDESRRYLRISFRRAVQIKRLDFSESAPRNGESRDIGIGGVLVRHDEYLEIGTAVQIGLPIGDQDTLLLIGQVVRVEMVGGGTYDLGVALAFKELEKLARSEIAHLLSGRRANVSGY